MANAEEDEIIGIIQDYIPFLKKICKFLKKKKEPQKVLNELQHCYTTFTGTDDKAKIAAYNKSKEKLERCYKRFNDICAQGGKKGKTSNKKNSENTLISAEEGDAPDICGHSSSSKESVLGVQNSQENIINSSTSSIVISSVSSASTSVNQSCTNKENNEDAATTSPPLAQPAATASPPLAQPEATASPPVAQVAAQSTPSVSEKQPQPPLVNVVKPMSSGMPDEVLFVCASCQFKTKVEAEFMKHTRTDHRTDLSMWCKTCGRCFSNAGVLVAHIKEQNCVKENMLYRCGVKDCTFETDLGQTFVHHLRHCHKGSPFIFCIHCQKIFTLPHCLILHMQNDCPFKFKNRTEENGENSAAASSSSSSVVSQPKPEAPKLRPIAPAVEKQPVVSVASTILPTQSVASSQPQAVVRPSVLPKFTQIPASSLPPKRGKKRGRTTRRFRVETDSDSEDLDDPSWQPEEDSTKQPVRRSARWAKKVFDAKEPQTSESDSSTEKGKKTPELPGKTVFKCECCDFSALFKSLLEGHYMTAHKNPKKNSCTVCNVKFESKQLFLDHFPTCEQGRGSPTANSLEMEVDSSPLPKEILNEASNSSTQDSNAKELEFVPYQTSGTQKTTKDLVLELIQTLKSKPVYDKMLSKTKLQHFFKCMIPNCTFTTDHEVFFIGHLSNSHEGAIFNCTYCLEMFSEAKEMTEHMLKHHGGRCYQCSLCFYRALTKSYVQIHVKFDHSDIKAEIYDCLQHLSEGLSLISDKENDIKTTWPFVCSESACGFKSFDSKGFKQHVSVHASCTEFICYYCKEKYSCFEDLMVHYRKHGIDNFQCKYCIHGTETQDELLFHLANEHADKPKKVHIRCPQEDQKEYLETLKKESVPVSIHIPPVCEITINKNIKFVYPIEIPKVGKNLYCRVGECNKLLKNAGTYLRHLNSVHQTLNYLCPHCAYTCDDVPEFNDHMLCHGPHLFACMKENCTFHSHLETKVQIHNSVSGHGDISMIKVIRNEPTSNPLSQLVDGSVIQLPSSIESQFVCPFCYYMCPKKRLMKIHLYSELVYKRFECMLCKHRMHSRMETKQHFDLVHSNHNIKCNIESNFAAENYVRYYLTGKLQEMVRSSIKNEGSPSVDSCLPSRKCKKCSHHFPTFRDFSFHLFRCMEPVYDPFVCTHCSTTACDLNEMRFHIYKKHPEEDDITYSYNLNIFVEGKKYKKFAEVRMNYFKDIITSVLDESELIVTSLNNKFYKCGYCNFTDEFRCNVEKHCLGAHPAEEVNVEKSFRTLDKKHDLLEKAKEAPMKAEVPPKKTEEPPEKAEKPKSSGSSFDSSSDSGEPMDTSSAHPYSCYLCPKTASLFDVMTKHILDSHPNLESGIFQFFYCPETHAEFSINDVELYSCAYCNVSQENLYHLKRHWENIHLPNSKDTFKVIGQRAQNGSVYECEFCKSRFASDDLLSTHTRFAHANEVVKRKVPPVVPSPNKRPKMTTKYQCQYCEHGLCDSLEAYLTHCKKQHPEKPYPSFKTVTEEKIQCDFCYFCGPATTLSQHIKTNHKNAVGCGYCNQRSVSKNMLQVHMLTAHSGWPMKFTNLCSDSFANATPDGNASVKVVLKSELSHFENITVNYKNDSGRTKLPVCHFAKMYDLFPVVKLVNVKKDTK